MKAAHIHLQHPNRKILFTFYTKSLYGLIKESIAKFYRHFAGLEPNWEYIDILHSWGGRSIDGVYFNACINNNHQPMDFSTAKLKNSSDPFRAVCGYLKDKQIKEKYDYILIDEAQDLPNEFFSICYKLAKGKKGHEKNIVWAYDELQSIFNVYQRTPIELFGLDLNGKPNIDLDKFKKYLNFGQNNDLVLYKCYRNPLEILLTAHALGFGIYSNHPVQMLENEEHWRDVGYNLAPGSTLDVGSIATITRDRANSPLSIYQYQSVEQIIKCYKANTFTDECEWIVNQIKGSIASGLKPHDILVISFDDRNAKTYFNQIATMLIKNHIKSNNLLTSSSAAPPFTVEDMITLSTVHRAKGNESSEVFAIGIDAIYQSRNIRSGRNKIFTAFTRTKAWLNISGIGEAAQFFINEVNKSIKNSPSLIFPVPDAEEIETIQRDLSNKPHEIAQLHKLYSQLLEQGYTEEQIQMELSFLPREKVDE